jgi:uncharacterized repeat protein (TIGR02543 family)
MKKNIFKYLTLILTLSLIMFAAGCKSKEITISFETNSGVQMTEIKVDQNALLTDIPDATRVGYDFIGWYYDVALSQILDEAEPVLRNITLYAKWQIQTYQIQFDVDGDISDEIEITYGTLITLPADPIKEGYHFLGWYVETNLFNEDTIVNSNTLLVARFEIDEYLITFDLGDGTTTSLRLTYGEELTELPSSVLTPQAGKIIVWKYFNDSVLGGIASFDHITSNMTVKSVYIDIYLDVTFDDGLGNVTVVSVKYGDPVSRPLDDPIKENYSFDGWFDSFNLQYDFNSAVTEEITITANYSILSFSVSFFDEDGQMIGIPQHIDYGSDAVAPSYTAPQGYEFTGWSVDFTNVVQTLIVNVLLQGDTFDITFETLGGTTVDPIHQVIGESIVRPSNPTRDGYLFGGWYTSVDMEVEYTTFTTMPYNGLTLYAKWTLLDPLTYTVTLERVFLRADIEQSRTITNIQVEMGTSYSPASNIVGYDFIHFLDIDSVIHTNISDTVTINSNQTIQVYYAKMSFTINFTQFLTTAEDTTADSFTVYYDETFTDVPSLILSGNASYSLVTWNRSVFQNVKSDIDVYGIYYPAVGETVTFLDNGTIKYIVKDSDIPSGPIITANAAIWNLQKTGFVFLGWFYDLAGNNQVSISELDFSLLTSSLTIYALWEELFPLPTPTDVSVVIVSTTVIITWNETMYEGVYPNSFILLIDGVEYTLTSADFSRDGNIYTCDLPFLNLLKIPGTHHIALKALGDNLNHLDSAYSAVAMHIVAVEEEEILEVAPYDYFIIETTISGNLNYIFYTDMTYNFSSRYVFNILEGEDVITANHNVLITSGNPGTFEIQMFKTVDGITTQSLISGQVVTYINQFQLGTSLTDFIDEATDSNYLNPVFESYKVGFRNDFYFDLEILNNTGTKVDIDDANLVFNFYLLVGDTYQLLEGEDLSTYVYQKPGYVFRFTSDAEGETFKMEVAPRYQALQMTVPTREFEFTVVDAYNAFTNEQLQTLFSDLNIHNIILQADIIAEVNPLYLNEDGSPMNGYSQTLASGTIDYRGCVYQRIGVSNDDELVLEGNYFTIDGSGLPFVKVTSDPDTDEFGNGGYTSVGVGTSSAYEIVSVQVAIFSYNVTPDPTGNIINNDNKVNYRNLTVLGNTTTPSINYSLSADEILFQEQLMSRNSGGLAGMMIRNGSMYLENVNVGYTGIAIFITPYGYKLDGVTPVSTNLDYVKLFDSWANSVYNFGSPMINITNSNIGSSGGAAIHLEDVRPGNTVLDNITVNMDNATVVNNWITGDEAWFKAYGFSGVALLLKSSAESFLTTVDKTIIQLIENQVTGAFSEKFNFVILSRDMDGADTFDESHNQLSGSEIIVNLTDATGQNTIARPFNFLSADMRSLVVSPGSLLFPVGPYSDSMAFYLAYLTAQSEINILTGATLSEGQVSTLAVNAIYIAGFYNITLQQAENAVLAVAMNGLTVYNAVMYVTGGVMPVQPQYLEIAQEAPGLGKVQLILEYYDKPVTE